MLAGCELPGDDAEREEIGAAVDVATAQLLGRHVARRSRCGAILGQPGHGAIVRIGDARQAEVENLDVAVGPADEVLRLQIPVDDVAGMGGREAGGDIDERRDQPVGSDRSARELGAQRVSFHQLGRDVELAVDFLEREDRRDRFVRERRGGAGFAREPIAVTPIARVLRRQRLERDRSPEALVTRSVDDAHAAAADFFEDLVGTNLLTHERRRIVDHQAGRDGPCRGLEELRARLMAREQRPYFLDEFGVGLSPGAEERLALRRRRPRAPRERAR